MSNDHLFNIKQVAEKVSADLINAPADSYEGYGLMKGKIGSVIYFYEMYKIYGKQEYIDKCFELLAELFEFINGDDSTIQDGEDGLVLRDYSFLQGRAGLGFALSYFEKEGVLDDMDESLCIIDNMLFPFCLQLLEKKFLDFLQGTFGIVHYFVQRSHKAEVQAFLSDFVDKYHSQMLVFDNGAIHLNNFGYLHKPGIDISLAHGVIGNYLVLLKIYDAGIQCEKIKGIIIKAITFIVSSKSDKLNNSFFPNYIEVDKDTNQFISKNHSYRLAWCNGDLNIVYFLYVASRKFNYPDITAFLDELLKDLVLRKSFDDTSIDESYFCHGSSGAAMMFGKLFELTSDKGCEDAKNYWIGQSFLFFEQEFAKYSISNKASFQFGWPGAVLGISSLLMKHNTVMDKIFLLDYK